MAGDILLDVSPQHVLDVFLLEPAFDNQLIAAVYSATGAKLSKQEEQQVLGLSVQHLGDLVEVCKRRLLAPNPHDLTNDTSHYYQSNQMPVLRSRDVPRPMRLQTSVYLLLSPGAVS